LEISLNFFQLNYHSVILQSCSSSRFCAGPTAQTKNPQKADSLFVPGTGLETDWSTFQSLAKVELNISIDRNVRENSAK